MKSLLFTVLSALYATALFSQVSTENYIKENTLIDTGKMSTKISYYDGLGRPFETVESGSSSSTNIITVTEYDGGGREYRHWQPFPSTSDFIVPGDAQTPSSVFYNDNIPYSSTSYENSPLDRITSVQGAGAAWSAHPKTQNYAVNTQSFPLSCHYYYASVNGSLTDKGQYASGSLSVTMETDENGNDVYSFHDTYGRTVLKRAMFDSSTSADTYYIYNYRGLLAYVLTPKYQSDGDLSLNAYQYKYDGMGNCIEKKYPGCEPIKMVYDMGRQLIFRQDGNQRKRNQWELTLPDRHGRPAVTGIVGMSAVPDISSSHVYASYTGGTGLGGYSVSGVSLGSVTLHTVRYYDGYGFLSLYAPNVSAALGYNSTDALDAAFLQGTTPDAQGYLTGECSYRSDGSTGTCVSSYYYGLRGRIVQSHASNAMGGFDHEYTGYTSGGLPQNVKRIHVRENYSSIIETYTYSYDQAGRRLKTTHAINDNIAVTLADYTYDGIGRCSLNRRSGHASLSTSYTYNVRSWLSSMSSPLFSEDLSYTYNGNVSTMLWKADSRRRGYGFNYDRLSRLTMANYYETASTSQNFSTQYTYDSMGNILTLKRNGLQDGGTYGLVDNLTYTYNGNQLTKISDSVEDPTYVGAFNFKDGADNSMEYTYDANGNMTSDKNKGITSITYNDINQPQKITFSDGKTTEYVYSYDGTKLQTIHKTLQPQTSNTTTYCGNLIYENGTLKRLLVDGGYVTFSGATPVYHFYIQDHLGNNRVVAKADGTVEQINHYYPYGGLMANICTGSDVQPYKYNGKELDRMHGLDTYDYGARQHNAATGRWDRMDQLAEENPEVSPYVYCGDNPINAIDIKGLFPKFLITQKSTPFYRADYYTLNLPTVHLLSLVSGVSEKHIRNAQIMQRGFGHYYPLYSSNEGGGAITLGNTPDNVSINFTPNFFEDDKNKYNGHGYGQDFYGWMNLLSHEVIHIKHIEECGNEISYLGGFLKDYITYGHDNTPREKEADEGTNNFKAFNKYIDNNYGKNSLYKLFKSDKSDKLKIQTINQWWNEYENETHINDIIY